MDICGACLGIDRQDETQPCEAKECQFGDGMFHTSCMVHVKRGTQDGFLCKACLSAGVELDDQEGGLEDEEEEEEGVDERFRTVGSYNGLRVGMPLDGGQVCEIYPGLDKFTVEVKTSSGAETRHHVVSKMAAKMIEKQAAEDWNIKLRQTLDQLD